MTTKIIQIEASESMQDGRQGRLVIRAKLGEKMSAKPGDLLSITLGSTGGVSELSVIEGEKKKGK